MNESQQTRLAVRLSGNRHVCGFFQNKEEEYRVLLPFIESPAIVDRTIACDESGGTLHIARVFLNQCEQGLPLQKELLEGGCQPDRRAHVIEVVRRDRSPRGSEGAAFRGA